MAPERRSASAPTLSVALCTFNGERFLPEQLASMLRQTRLPDELVACDDGSTDGTLELLRSFASAAPFPVRVATNERRLGSTKNFERALGICRGELIALSDQDDVWAPDRLAASAEYLATHPQAAFVFSDGSLIDEQGAPLPGSLWSAFHFDAAKRRALAGGDFRRLLPHRFVTGATVMLRASARCWLLPIPELWVHDEWMAAVTPFFAEFGMLARPLIAYRVHATQQVGARGQRAHSAAAHWGRILRQRDQLRALLDFLAQHPPERRPELLAAHRERASFLEWRAGLPRRLGARLWRVAAMLPQYRHAAGLGSALKDVLLRPPP